MKKIIFNLILVPFFIFGQPVKDSVQKGNVTISQINNEMIVDQSSDKAIINWQDFSISSLETVKFVMPSNESSALNRVIGDKISNINGNLQSNGWVYLINRNGIIIGPNGKIDTNGFIASTLDVGDQDYLNGKNISFSGDSDKKIENHGLINAIQGDILIFAKEIENNGNISAKKGNVELVAGYDVFLVSTDRPKAAIRLKKEGKIENTNLIEAVNTELKAAGGNIYDLAIQHSGIIEAQDIAYQNGKIILVSEKTTAVSGSLLANSNDEGGSIQVLGEKVCVDSGALIEARGKNSGGEIYIGGGYQGKNPDILNSEYTIIDKETQINADAIENGNGGEVIVWGNKMNLFYGNISARGGSEGGDGGFIEISSPINLIFKGLVDTTADHGLNGILLLDPSNIAITNTSPSNPSFATPYNPGPSEPNPCNVWVTDLETTLATSNVQILTNNGDQGNGDITISTGITWASSNSLTLTANKSVTIALSSPISGGGDLQIDFGLTTSGVFEINSSITANSVTVNGSAFGNTYNLNNSASNAVINGDIFGNDTFNINNGCNVASINGAGGSNIFNIDVGGDVTSSINGGTGSSTFVFSDGAVISVTIDGGSGGTNTINFSAYTTDRTFTLTASNQGTIDTGTTISFQNITDLIGGTGNDTFDFSLANLTGSVNGGGGLNTLKGASTWIITGDNAGTLDGTPFSNMQKLIGGTGDDSFTFNGAYQISGIAGVGIDGNGGNNLLVGPNVINAWTITADDAGTINPTGATGATTFQDIQSLAGGTNNDTFTFNGAYRISGIAGVGIDGNGGNNIVRGPDLENVWAITADDKGTINPGAVGVTTFQDIQTLIGGEENDTFTFNGAYQISGIIVGDDGTNTIVGPNINTTWTMSSVNSGTVNPTGATGATTFQDIQIITCGSADDLLIGPNAINNWSIIGDDAVTLLNTSFSSMQKLVGGVGNDTFTFNGAYQISGIGGIGIDGNGGSNTITGPNVLNAWIITADDSGTIDPTGATGATAFVDIQLLTGGTVNDVFTFNGAYQISGVGGIGINGNGGSNTIVGPNVNTIWTMNSTNAGTVNPTGATGATTFQDIQVITCGSADNSLTGPNAVNNWSIIGNNTVSIFSTFISNMKKLVGGTNNDTFTFNGAYQISGIAGVGIDGNGGSNTIVGPNINNAWTITSDDSGTINPTGSPGATTFQDIQLLTGGTGNDTFTFNGAYQISGVGGIGIDGNGGSNTIIGPNVNNTWTITSADNGTITPIGATGATTFQDIQFFTGGSSDDSFIFSDGTTISGAIDGGSSGTNTINLFSYTTDRIFTLTASNQGTIDTGTAISFQNITDLVGGAGNDIFDFSLANLTGSVNGGGGLNTLKGASAWIITADNAGTLDGTPFSSMQKLVGGTGSDTFTFNGAYQISGIAGVGIDGNGGSNTIIGPNVNNTWTITSADNGTITPIGATGATTFQDIQFFTGGSSDDSFIFSDGATISGAIDGGSSGTNTINFSSYTTDRTFTLTASNQGTIDTAIAISFQNITDLIGGSGNDIFDFSAANLTGSVNGGGGLNTLKGASTWIITGDNAGTLDGTPFSSMQKLVGGTGSDTFTFNGAYQISGIAGIGINGNGGSNTIVGPNIVNTWAITSNDGGTINSTGATGATAFQDIQNVTGGNNNDTFVFSDGITIAGIVNGGSGGINILNYSLYTTATSIILSSIGVNGASGNDVGITAGFSNITDILGGSDMNNNFFTGTNLGDTWTINGSTNNSTISNGGNTINFKYFENLTGGTGDDNLYIDSGSVITVSNNGGDNKFYLRGGDVSTSITGGVGKDEFIFSDGQGITGKINGGSAGAGNHNTLNYDDYTTPVTINLRVGSATNVFGGNINGISNIQDGAGSGDLIGGDEDDIFYIGGTTGNVDGGGGINTLIVRNKVNNINITSQYAGHINSIGEIVFTNIQNIVGAGDIDTFNLGDHGWVLSVSGESSLGDVLVGPNKDSIWVLSGNNSGYIHGSPTTIYEYIENLTGGSGDDRFVMMWPDGYINGDLDGGGGYNILDYSNYPDHAEVHVDLIAKIATGVGGHIYNIQEIVYPETSRVFQIHAISTVGALCEQLIWFREYSKLWKLYLNVFTEKEENRYFHKKKIRI